MSKTKLMESGAHYIIESIKELPDVVEDINKRLALGETP
jgi:phosphonoacetaldehyde hydrolase